MKIIGLGHYSRTGKDTLANAVIAALNEYSPSLRVKKVPFAWKLKQIAHELYGWDGLREPGYYDTREGEKFRDVILPRIGLTPVEIWIKVGNLLREVYGKTWIEYVIRGVQDVDVLIVPDVRFPNEVEALREADALLGKVVRPGYGPRKSISDRALLPYRGWDFVVGASGKMSELENYGKGIASWLAAGVILPQQDEHEKLAALGVERIEPWEEDHKWLPAGASIIDGRLVLPGDVLAFAA